MEATDNIVRPRLYYDDGWPLNKFKPYWWNNPLDINNYDHTMPIGAWYEEDVYYRPEYAIRTHAEPFESFEDGTDVYNHIYDGGINYVLEIPTAFRTFNPNTVPSVVDTGDIEVGYTESPEEYAEHRHLPPTQEMLYQDKLKNQQITDTIMNKFKSRLLEMKRMGQLDEEKLKYLDLDDLLRLSPPDPNKPEPGQVFLEANFYDENGNYIKTEQVPANESARQLQARWDMEKQMAAQQQAMNANSQINNNSEQFTASNNNPVPESYSTVLNVGGEGYNEHLKQQPINEMDPAVSKYGVPLPDGSGYMTPHVANVPPNGYRSNMPGYDPHQYFNQYMSQMQMAQNQNNGYYGMQPNNNMSYMQQPVPQQQNNGFIFAPIVPPQQYSYYYGGYRPRVDYNNPYPQFNYNNFNPYGAYARSPFISMQMQQQIQMQEIKANKIRYRMACHALGQEYDETYADQLFNPMSQATPKTPEEIAADQNWNEVKMFMFYADHPGLIRSQEQIDADYIQRKYRNYHEALDNHSLCEFLEEDLPRLMREFWIEDNIKKDSSRDHSKLYDSDAYNNLLRMHAASSPYLTRLMREAQANENKSDAEVGVSDVLSRNADPNFIPDTPPDYLMLPEVQERRRQFTESLLQQVYQKNDMPPPDRALPVESPPQTPNEANKQIAANIDALIKSMPSATMIT